MRATGAALLLGPTSFTLLVGTIASGSLTSLHWPIATVELVHSDHRQWHSARLLPLQSKYDSNGALFPSWMQSTSLDRTSMTDSIEATKGQPEQISNWPSVPPTFPYFSPTMSGQSDALAQANLSSLSNFTSMNFLVSPLSTDLGWSDNQSSHLEDLASLPLLRYSAPWIVVLCIAYLVVFLLGLVGNLSVLWVIFILRRNSRHSMFATCNKVFNGLIGNLALADLLVIIFCLPATLISNIFTPYFLGRFVCKSVQYFQGVSVSASVYTLVAISIDRFYGIYYPFNNGFSQVVRRSVIMFIWLLSFVIAIPWILFFDLVEAGDHRQAITMCQEVWPNETLPDLYFLVVNLGFQYLVPLSIILVFYMLLMLKIWHRKIPVFHSAARRETSTDTVDQWNARIVEQSKMKVLKMLIVIVSLFALSWLPLYLIFLHLKFGQYDENSSFDKLVISITPLAQWLGASNSCVNPILYFFFNAKFRAYLKKAITRSLLCSSSIEFTRNHIYYNNNMNNTNCHNLQQQQPAAHLQVNNGHNHTFNQVNCANHKMSQNMLLSCASNNNSIQVGNNNNNITAKDDVTATLNGKSAVVNLDQVVDTMRMYCCQNSGKTSSPFNSNNSSPKPDECEQNETNERNRLIMHNGHERNNGEGIMHKNGAIQPITVCDGLSNGVRTNHFATLDVPLNGIVPHLSPNLAGCCHFESKTLLHFAQHNSLLRSKFSRETQV